MTYLHNKVCFICLSVLRGFSYYTQIPERITWAISYDHKQPQVKSDAGQALKASKPRQMLVVSRLVLGDPQDTH